MKKRKTSLLRKGRISVSHAIYFVTAVTKDRVSVLDNPGAKQGMKHWLNLCQQKMGVEIYGLILMPDHIHVLFRLGSNTSLPQFVRMMKYHIRNSSQTQAFEWQSGYFDHRLREEEDLESYARYIFLNPYRSKLVMVSKKWPYWIGNQCFEFSFERDIELLGSVPIQWLNEMKNPFFQWQSFEEEK